MYIMTIRGKYFAAVKIFKNHGNTGSGFFDTKKGFGGTYMLGTDWHLTRVY